MMRGTRGSMMLNKTGVFVVALALAAAPVSSWSAAPSATSGSTPVGGASVGGGAAAPGGVATPKRSQRKPRHPVAAPQGTRQPVVKGRQPIVKSN
jgi:hypothetical protein